VSGLRRVVFWCHLAAGITVGTVVLVMSVTGVLLAYERQIVEWADGYRLAPPPAGAPRLGPEALLARVREARPEARPTTIVLKSDPQAPAALGLGRQGTVFVDPYSGRVLGEGSARARAFFRGVTDWHRWLATEGRSREAGRAVTGAANLAFLFLVASGLYLWWPRKRGRAALAAATLFRRGLRGKARDFSWHNVVGFWSALPLLLMVASAATISYPWASDLVYRLTGSEPPPRRAPAAGGGGGERERRPAPRLDGLDAAWARAEGQVPGWRTITLRLPAGAADPASFTIDTSRGAARPDKRGQLTVDLASGAVVRWEPYAGQSLGRRVRSWTRWIHTGEAAGVVGQAIAGLASAGAVFLVYTGHALAWRRWRARRRRALERQKAVLIHASGPSPAASVQATRN
jgi:uncharacterized iron-regulated membrane protein